MVMLGYAYTLGTPTAIWTRCRQEACTGGLLVGVASRVVPVGARQDVDAGPAGVDAWGRWLAMCLMIAVTGSWVVVR